jgi:hypothetical protein
MTSSTPDAAGFVLDAGAACCASVKLGQAANWLATSNCSLRE